MKSGQLSKRIHIQAPTETEGEYGGVEEVWATKYQRWANVRPVGGREPYINDHRLPELDLVVILRYDSKTKTITPKNRVLYSGRILEIESVVNVQEENKEIRLFCVELIN